MFIESCEVQLSSAIVASMLQYLIQSLQKHAQNMSIQLIQEMKKKKKEIENLQRLYSFQILFIHKYITVRKLKKKKKGAVLQKEPNVNDFTVRVNVEVMWTKVAVFCQLNNRKLPSIHPVCKIQH